MGTDQETGSEPEEDSEERGTLREEITIRAGGEPVAGPLGANNSSVEFADSVTSPATLTDALVRATGVSLNGQGGLFQVVSVRGVSRQRITHLVSGARISSERRAGVSTSFIDPLLMQSVDVLRGPASTTYGSGALGGVLRTTPRVFDGYGIDLGYESNGNGRHQVGGIGGDGWSFGLAHRQAREGETANGERLNNDYDQYSATLRGWWNRGSLRYDLLAIPSYGREIGKANNEYPERITDYPRERHGLIRFSATSERGWEGQLFVHGQDLVTEVREAGVGSGRVENESIDFGARWDGTHDLSETLRLSYGAESYSRRNVTARESMAPRSLDDAEQDELGGYGTVQVERFGARWEAGARYSWISQKNRGSSSDTLSEWNAHVGFARPLGQHFELRGAVSSGIRFPSLTELFFSGITGRGQVIGNPDLRTERALNAETTLRWVGPRSFVGGTVYRNEIDDYIERVELAEDLLTFVNLTSGTIEGVELEGAFHPGGDWQLLWSGHKIRGRDSRGERLADIPPLELSLGVARGVGRLSLESRLNWRDGKDDPGNAEVETPSALLAELTVARRFGDGWTLALGATNLLDEAYLRSADRRAPEAPGRAFTIRASWSSAPR